MDTTTTSEWKNALTSVREDGVLREPGSSGAEWRGRATRELLAYQTRIPMTNPVVASPAREMGRRFLVAEAAWILSGDNRVSTIEPYARRIRQFSDDGHRFFGAYGPPFVSQISHVVRALTADPSSRQAVIDVWRPNPPQSKDTPCTLSWQFIRGGGRLDCVATMRSSDLWTGWVYDVFNFSMVSAAVLLELRRAASAEWTDVELGYLHLTAGSQHLYRLDFEVADKAAREPASAEHVVAPLDLSEFHGGMDSLTEHLWTLARVEQPAHRFLTDYVGARP